MTRQGVFLKLCPAALLPDRISPGHGPHSSHTSEAVSPAKIIQGGLDDRGRVKMKRQEYGLICS